MKKFYSLLGVTSLSLVLIACNGDADTSEETDNETDEETTGQSDEEDDVAEADDDGEMTVEEIIDAAIAAEDDFQSIYSHSVMTTGVDGDTEADVPEEETGVAQEEELIEYIYHHEDGSVSNRMERMIDGEPTEYTAGDSEYTLTYTEDEDVAYRVEQVDVEGDPADVNVRENQFDQMMEDYEVTLEGEEEINDYMTYHLTFSDEEEVRHYWIDQDTFEVIRLENEHAENPFRITFEVLEYELDIDYDEAFFQLEDVIGDDVEIEDRDQDEHLEAEIEDIEEDIEDEDE
ncbi:hypothetical protein ACE1TF_06485 [Geomicrobium sp. JSM 1781026]|uniref:hypothetical protein n=1 Tax=Geomicrobium sp. JSM 1781026 TaxID=3344580 RepID=UPI0035C0D6F1